jgi:hypothetical protein
MASAIGRSDTCVIASKILPASIPHIRAIDIPPVGERAPQKRSNRQNSFRSKGRVGA